MSCPASVGLQVSRAVYLISALLLVLISGTSSGDDVQRTDELRYSVQEERTRMMIGNLFIDASLHNKYSAEDLTNAQFKFLTPNEGLDVSLTAETGVLRIGDEGFDRDVMCARQRLCEITLDVLVTTVADRFLEILKVVLEVTDINDNAPVFSGDYNVGDQDRVVFEHYMPESAQVGSTFSIPPAYDPDSGRRGRLSYDLLDTADAKAFELRTRETRDGAADLRLVLLVELDRERQSEYSISVRATDSGESANSGELVVRINVTDVNDHSPVFNNTTYSITVYENIPIGTVLLQVTATDRDSGLYGTVIYSFSPSTQEQFGHVFAIHNTTGEVRVVGEVDFEHESMYQLFVYANDLGPSSVPAEAVVIIHVQDLNDNAPEIRVNTLVAAGTSAAMVLEHAQIGTFVGQVTVTDPDLDNNGVFGCALNLPEFELQERFPGEYQIITSTELDREVKSAYDLSVICQDQGSRPKQTTKHLTVTVGDINDHAPLFQKDVYHGTLIENNHIGAFLLQVNATDQDSGANADIVYLLERADGLFSIDPASGRITAQAIFDREGVSPIEFTAVAVDHGLPRRSSSVPVIVDLIDTNDERPYFSKAKYSFGVYENQPYGTPVGAVIASDADSDIYAEISYQLWPDVEQFSINELTGLISTTRALDREKQAEYYLTIMALDQGQPPQTGSTSVVIFVADRNDNAPRFDFPQHIVEKRPRSEMISSRRSSDPGPKYNDTISISPLAPVGYRLAQLRASDLDRDENANLTYSAVRTDSPGSDLFTVDTWTGDVTVSQELSHIDRLKVSFAVRVSDRGQPRLSDTSGFTILIDSSVPFTQHQTKLLTETNIVVLVVMATISAILVTFLIIAIVVIYRRNQSRDPEPNRLKMQISRFGILKSCYNRQDKFRKNSDKPSTPSSPGDFLFSYHSNGYGESPSYKLDLQRGETSHMGESSSNHIVADDSSNSHIAPAMISFGVEQRSRLSQRSNRLTDSIVHSNQSGSSTLRRVTSSTAKDTGDNTPTEVKHYDYAHKELEVNELLKLLKQEREDADSAYSGGISSATNSITAVDHNDTSINGSSRDHMTDFIQSDCRIREYERSPGRSSHARSPREKQPALDSPVSLNHHPARNPVMSRSPPYSVHYTSVSTNDNTNNSNCNTTSTTATDDTRSSAAQGHSDLGSSVASLASICSSTQVVPNVSDLSAIDGSYLGAIYETNRNSKSCIVPSGPVAIDNTMMTEGSGFQYSCADVSEALNHGTSKTPNNFRRLLLQTPKMALAKDPASDIDVTSTTFKGGVSMATTESCVDPQELVNRIDELFFPDMMV